MELHATICYGVAISENIVKIAIVDFARISCDQSLVNFFYLKNTNFPVFSLNTNSFNNTIS